MESLLGKIRQKKEIKAELKQEAKPETVDCKACGKKVDRAEAIRRLYVCPECGGYFRVNAKNRVKMVADTGSFTSGLMISREEIRSDFRDMKKSFRQCRKKRA